MKGHALGLVIVLSIVVLLLIAAAFILYACPEPVRRNVAVVITEAPKDCGLPPPPPYHEALALPTLLGVTRL